MARTSVSKNANARAGKRRVSKTERPVTPAQRAAALQLLLENGQFHSVRDAHFYAGDHSLPIATLPVPKPCPHCGHRNGAEVAFSPEGATPTHARVVCDNCHAEGPFVAAPPGVSSTTFELAYRAALEWNKRAAS